jgi:diadenosine tetraphosphatase ApaH/serine/threonine PP2A family protein phosphatase
MTGNPLPNDGSARKIGIISDIHGNLHALQSTLDTLEEIGVDRIVCCGDLVGYGAHPNEVVELIRERNIPAIAGNHDHAALLLTDISYFNQVAKEAVLWTKKVLTPENAAFLRDLPLFIQDSDPGVFFVHASPRDPGEWNYIITMGDARDNFNYFTETVCFVGHSHQPFIIENNDGSLHCSTRPEIEVKESCRYLVNVGSVGQPRDRKAKPCFVVYDTEAGLIEIKRSTYDLAAAQRAIIEAGLPRELAERLEYGI